MHVVIDHDQRCRLVDPLDDGDEPLGLRIGQAGRRLVEQNQPRFVGQHDADLDQLALPMRKLADQPARNVAQLELRHDFVDRRLGAVVPGRDAAGGKPEVLRTVSPFITEGTCVLMPTPSRTIWCVASR